MSTMVEVSACVTMLASTLRHEVTPPMLEGYFMALEDLTVAQLKQAVKAALKRCRFMPSPVELREFAGRREAAYHRLLPPVPGLREWATDLKNDGADLIRSLADKKS